MSILINKSTKIIVQGITGTQASFHTRRAMEYGTNIVGGVTPGKGGIHYLGVPIFENVFDAVKETRATASLMFVPAKAVVDATREAIDAGILIIVCITNGVPIQDMIRIKDMLKGTKVRFVGPNTPGIITPNEAKMGIFPENIHKSGYVGVVSRSSTLTYEAVIEIEKAGLGQSTVVGLGDDMIAGSDLMDIVDLFLKDNKTKIIVVIGTLGGTFEEKLSAHYKKLQRKKPIIGFIAGSSLPNSGNLGYAGDIITNGHITADDKKKSMQNAGIFTINRINDLHNELLKLMKKNA